MLDSNKNTNFNQKLILKHKFMHRTIHTILRYDTIYMIYILYYMIHEYFSYALTIQNFLHDMIRIIQYWQLWSLVIQLISTTNKKQTSKLVVNLIVLWNFILKDQNKIYFKLELYLFIRETNTHTRETK